MIIFIIIYYRLSHAQVTREQYLRISCRNHTTMLRCVPLFHRCVTQSIFTRIVRNLWLSAQPTHIHNPYQFNSEIHLSYCFGSRWDLTTTIVRLEGDRSRGLRAVINGLECVLGQLIFNKNIPNEIIIFYSTPCRFDQSDRFRPSSTKYFLLSRPPLDYDGWHVYEGMPRVLLVGSFGMPYTGYRREMIHLYYYLLEN